MTSHGLSFDLEDWCQLVSKRVDGVASEPSRDIDACVDAILALCDDTHVKATFFVVGLLARSRPDLVRRVAAAGHEIASHSLEHQLLPSLSHGALVDDLRASKALLEDLSGQEVIGFRAPEFTVERLDHPCFAVLRELGFRYDSSVFPIGGLRYGIANAPRTRFQLDTSAGPLVEFPLATTTLGPWSVPIAGGSHFRVLPRALITWSARRADRRGESLVFYFHPYEFSRRFQHLPGGFARNRSIARHVVLHNFATRRIERTLRALLDQLRLVPLRELM